MSADKLYEKIDKLALDFTIIFQCDRLKKVVVFQQYWHEKWSFCIFKKARALLSAMQKRYSVKPGVLVVINSNEMHYIESVSQSME
jgi:hypothetical protein